MAIQTNIQWEVTDTFSGEANYSWVKRGVVETKPKEEFSNLAAVRRAKKAAGWEGVRCKTMDYGDMIELRPYGACVVMFITFHSFGSCGE